MDLGPPVGPWHLRGFNIVVCLVDHSPILPGIDPATSQWPAMRFDHPKKSSGELLSQTHSKSKDCEGIRAEYGTLGGLCCSLPPAGTVRGRCGCPFGRTIFSCQLLAETAKLFVSLSLPRFFFSGRSLALWTHAPGCCPHQIKLCGADVTGAEECEECGGSEREGVSGEGCTDTKLKSVQLSLLWKPVSASSKKNNCCILLKGIFHFEINVWYVLSYLKGIQDVGVLVSAFFIFLGQTVLVCQSVI